MLGLQCEGSFKFCWNWFLFLWIMNSVCCLNVRMWNCKNGDVTQNEKISREKPKNKQIKWLRNAWIVGTQSNRSFLI